MESISEPLWDAVIAGTGLQESLLALSLSRSDKKVLHVDTNDYYGGVEAAFSLQEIEQWVTAHSSKEELRPVNNAVIEHQDNAEEEEADGSKKLSFPRAYSLALAPQIIYTRSEILPALVAAKVDSQLEFLAVGNWFVCSRPQLDSEDSASITGQDSSPVSLFRIPSTREDILRSSLSRRSKQLLTKFLRFLSAFDDVEQREVWEPYAEKSFKEFLVEQFDLPLEAQHLVMALVMETRPSQQVRTRYALLMIARHLGSMGLFGEGFAAVVPKWGGLAEIAQVGCRACAVGGATYMLGNSIKEDQAVEKHPSEQPPVNNDGIRHLRLTKGEDVKTRWLVASCSEMPAAAAASAALKDDSEYIGPHTVCHATAIVSSSLDPLFPPLAESGPPPAVAVVALPTSAISKRDALTTMSEFVYLMVHSSDTGECPKGQCTLYASVGIGDGVDTSIGHDLISTGISKLLSAVDEDSFPKVLWKMRYERRSRRTENDMTDDDDGVILFPTSYADLVFDDMFLRKVEYAWDKITAGDNTRGDFLTFDRREQEVNDDEQND